MYKQQEWQRQVKIGSFHSHENRRKREVYRQKFRLSIFEFPYHMRLRANYRDFAFIEGVSFTDTANYFNEYYWFTAGLAKTLDGLKRQLVKARQGS